MKQLFNPFCCCGGGTDEQCLVKGPLSDEMVDELLERDFRDNGATIPVIKYRRETSGHSYKYNYSVIDSEGYSVGGPFVDYKIPNSSTYQYKSGMIVEIQYKRVGAISSGGFYEIDPSTGKIYDPDNKFPTGIKAQHSSYGNINLDSFNIILRKCRDEIDTSQLDDIDKLYDKVPCQCRVCDDQEEGYFSGWKTKEEILDLLSGNNFNGEPGIRVYIHSFRREWVDNGSV